MVDDVADVIQTYPGPARQAFERLRAFIIEVAENTPSIGEITESLKWGEPSYVPRKARIGTAVRIAWKDKSPDSISLFVNCQTRLIDEWRELYADEFEFSGNRELKLPLSGDWPEASLRHCLAMALTYFVRK